MTKPRVGSSSSLAERVGDEEVRKTSVLPFVALMLTSLRPSFFSLFAETRSRKPIRHSDFAPPRQ
jgi:hypothetical protein